MLNQIKSSTQTALDHYFDLTENGTVHMTEQSFSAARQKLNWNACRELFEGTVLNAYDGGITTWRGFRVLAIDGSKVQLPADSKLREHFGCAGPTNSAPSAQMSCLYDCFNDFIVDIQLEPFVTSERTLAKTHIEKLCELPTNAKDKDLVLLDRGYPSTELLRFFHSQHVDFLARIKKGFNKTIDALPLGMHAFELGGIPMQVAKFLLPTEEVETLITSIGGKHLGINAYKELYTYRWGIETKYNELKHKFELENFSGRTVNAIYQDVFISALLSNMAAIAANEAQPIIDISRSDKSNKYTYHVNKNHTVGVFKDRFILTLLEDNPRKQAKMLDQIIQKLAQHVTPYRPGRTSPRKSSSRRANFYHNSKSNS